MEEKELTLNQAILKNIVKLLYGTCDVTLEVSNLNPNVINIYYFSADYDKKIEIRNREIIELLTNNRIHFSLWTRPYLHYSNTPYGIDYSYEISPEKLGLDVVNLLKFMHDVLIYDCNGTISFTDDESDYTVYAKRRPFVEYLKEASFIDKAVQEWKINKSYIQY